MSGGTLDAREPSPHRALRAAVNVFRRSVERYARSSPHSPLHGFPSACCKTASLLLSRYLAEQGFGEAELVANGKRGLVPHIETHAWLHLGDQTIDITADQFGPQHPPVIVGAAESLHATFGGVTVHAFDTYMTFNALHQARHDSMYTEITALIALAATEDSYHSRRQ